MMANYNAWANARLYSASLQLSSDALRRDMGVFFRSMHGTLNHLYVADTIWMSRFRGLPNPPWTLDHIAHDDPKGLQKRREALDRDIIGFTGGLEEAQLNEEFSYFTVKTATRMTQRLSSGLAHFFNHQTHHRGHCHAMLTQLGTAAPALDLLYFQRGD
jgi:uncharacterized damage-inducible protein DinB